jgi:hypothetical protein
LVWILTNGDTRGMVADLERAIAQRFTEWGGASVELAIYGEADPGAVGRAIEAFCQRELASGVKRTLFYQSSVGAVAGLELLDGRRVVVKAYQPDRSRERLAEVARLQTELVRAQLLAPAILRGPAPLGRGWALVEELVDRGVVRDGHEPVVRRALARALQALVSTLAPFVASSPLPSILFNLPSDRLWPKPHSSMFDFDATRLGAERIDALAAEARRRLKPIGRWVLGHSDWRAEHVRFEAERPVVAYDWDSLYKEREPALLGAIAHGFCSDWSKAEHVQAPTLDEARDFVRAYEEARGVSFDVSERALCGAAFAFGVAYTARCGHAAGKDERARPGTAQHLIEVHGHALLEL